MLFLFVTIKFTFLMRKSISLCIVSFLLFGMSVFCQNRTADSLVFALNKTNNDIDRVQLLNSIADAYKGSDPKRVLEYAGRALKLSQKIKHRIAEGNAFLNIGNGNIIIGNYTEALRNFSNAQAIFEKLSETNSGLSKEDIANGLARSYGSIAIVFSEQSNYARALQYHLKAVKIYEKEGNLKKIAQIYNNIGIVYQSQGDDFKALDYFVKCLDIQQKLGDKSLGINMTNIGNVYLHQKNYQKAFDYYMRAQEHFLKYVDSRGLGELYNNLGLYYDAIDMSDKSLGYFRKALATFESIHDKFGIADTYYFIGGIYLRQKNYDEALRNTNKSLILARELGILEQIRNAEKNISTIYEKLGQSTHALSHFKSYKIANDSISSNEAVRNGVRAEMNFEFEKKEALQKKEQEKKEVIYSEAAKRHQQQIIFIILFILAVFGIVFLIYNRLQLKKTLTLQKELAEYEQKALHLQMNPHFVFNCLGSISSFIVQNGTDSAIKYLSKFSKLMRLTLEYSKEALIPIDKEIESLQNYLELEQLRFNQKFNFVIHKSGEIEDDMALPPLLLQPFVENAIIHGLIPKRENGSITVDFSIIDQSIICTVIDNGIGFHKSQELKENLVSLHKSMALDITKKRLEMMQAFSSKASHVSIEEISDSAGVVLGTKVTLKLPIQYISKK